MRNKLIILFATIGLLAALTSCTSKKSGGDVESGEGEISAGTDAGLDAGLDAGNASPGDSLSSDTLSEDSLNAGTSGAGQAGAQDSLLADTPLDGSSEIKAPDQQPLAEIPPATTDQAPPLAPEPTAQPPTDGAPTALAEVPPPPPETVTSSAGMTDLDKKEEKPKVAMASLQKVPEKPMKKKGMILNAVYFAKPNDTLSTISQAIYGADKSEDLKKANPSYAKKDPKPGDKVYYNSPNRPTDSEKMLTYYEDNGIAPKTYTAQEGDDIKKVSEKLLGYKGAWKEVWAYNSVESKGKIEPGVELKYWDASPASASGAIPPVAMNNPPADTMMPPPPPAEAMNPPPPPPPPTEAMNPPPPMDLPPPPPPMEQAPPPPPPMENHAAQPPKPKKQASVEPHEETSAADGDMTMMLAAGGIAAAALAALIIIRKRKRQKELEQAINETQVGT